MIRASITKIVGLFLASVILGPYAQPLHAQDTLSWFAQGRPTQQAAQAIGILEAADADGLDSRDYRSSFLRQEFEKAGRGSSLSPTHVRTLDVALTHAMQDYLLDLHQGRVDPRSVQHDFKPSGSRNSDVAAYLSSALSTNTLGQAVANAAPRIPLYQSLRRALAQYRVLNNHPAWAAQLPSLSKGQIIRPGDAYEGLSVLVWRLMSLGDLPDGTPVPPNYQGPVVDGIRAFQIRHGLTPDGVLGQATMKQLQVTPAQRVRQIALTLERLRWTPLSEGRRMVVINIPEFVLRAYEIDRDKVDVRSEMKVIVGRAKDTRTPVFQGNMNSIEFSPYWNVPISIARAETIPKLRANPAYLRQQGFEFVSPKGQVSTTVSASNLDAVARGQLRIRQRPGPENALGTIKFVFPNDKNIYLHHTPASQLFNRSRRDFSHGCIRVEDPLALARFVLQDQPEWTDDRIKAYMASGVSRHVRVEPPVPVVIAYGTVVVKNGKVYFFADLYGQDALLDKALQNRQRRTHPLLSSTGNHPTLQAPYAHYND